MSVLTDIRKAYLKYLALEPIDQWAIDFALVNIMSCKADEFFDPLFGIIIGPPSVGKTEILRPFFDRPGLSLNYSHATENAFVSGASNVNKSLVDRLDRRAMIHKDMTTLLNDKSDDWDKFFHIMRELWDGAYNKASGAREDIRAPRARFSFIGAVTEEVYRFMDRDADLGQRFDYFRMFRKSDRAARKAQYRIAVSNDQQVSGNWREALSVEVRAHLDTIRGSLTDTTANTSRMYMKRDGEGNLDYKHRQRLLDEEQSTNWIQVRTPIIRIDEAISDTMFPLTNSVSRIRSAKPSKERATAGEEGPARFAKQIWRYGKTRAALDGRDYVNNDDLEFMRVIAHDTVTPSRINLLRALVKATEIDPSEKKGADIQTFVQHTNLAAISVENLLRHWRSHGFVQVRIDGMRLYHRLSEEAHQDLVDSRILDEPSPPSDWEECYD